MTAPTPSPDEQRLAEIRASHPHFVGTRYDIYTVDDVAFLLRLLDVRDERIATLEQERDSAWVEIATLQHERDRLAAERQILIDGRNRLGEAVAQSEAARVAAQLWRSKLFNLFGHRPISVGSALSSLYCYGGTTQP